jgi:ABC-type multidrug transport system ATPase subunit
MALMLFEGDDVKKRLSALSGGEAARLVFARLALEHPNVLVLDEPTNHLDLESIEALVEGLQSYEGTLILVSHDRWFISQLATRVVDIQPGRIVDYLGTYDEYVAATGDDHLDTEKVVLKAKAEKRRKGSSGDGGRSGGNGKPEAAPRRLSEYEKRTALERHHEVERLITAVESRIADIEGLFADPEYYGRATPDEMRVLEDERAGLTAELAGLMKEWERGAELVGELG